METTLIRVGEKIHVTERRRFESDLRRHFVGEVIAVSGGSLRARGYVFILNTGSGIFERKPEVRTRLVSTVDANNIINILPDNVDLDAVRYDFDAGRRLAVTDGGAFHLDINEFGPSR